MREQRVLHIEDTSQIERSKWVLDSPNPPPLWKKLLCLIKETVLPHGDKLWFSSSSKKKSFHAHALCYLHKLFPILVWLKDYTASKFKDDLLAGLTLASLCIPQSIGYASLAKVDPQYGLYTSIVPPLIYAVMGSSRDIAIGPVAVVSMLLSSLVTKVIDPVANPHAYRDFVFTVTFFTGIFQAGFGIFRLGFLVDFLSHAALVGFMAGAAIIIGLQQLKGLLGITHFTTKTDAVSVLVSVYKSLHQQITSSEEKWSPMNFVLGCSFLIFLLVTRFIGRKNKKLFWLPAIAPLLSVILSTLIVYLSKADKQGVNVIKHVKGGLNQSSVHQLQFHGQNVGQAAKIGLVCAVIALTEAMAVGRSFASIKGYQLDGNREMLSMGIMNIAGSLTSCYVATGSFSRTAVNFSAGCQTAVSQKLNTFYTNSLIFFPNKSHKFFLSGRFHRFGLIMMMVRHGGSSGAMNTAMLLAKKGLLGAEVSPNKWGSLVIRNGSTLAANLSDQKENNNNLEKMKSSSPGSANGGNKDEKGIMSYWGIRPSKITKQDGTEWKWNCFRPWETYKADVTIDLNKHHAPTTFLDKMAYWTVKSLRYPTDLFFQRRYGCRAMMLETVAAVPGMVGGMLLHCKSLRRFEHSGGWIKALLEEAENERMHLMTFMEVAKPRWYERALVITVQGVFFNAYFLGYLVSPKFAHRMVGYLEEEAIHSYTEFLKELDKGNIENVPAPAIAIDYWQLPPNSTLRDVVMVVRADEAHHRDVNHFASDIHYQGRELREAAAPIGYH